MKICDWFVPFWIPEVVSNSYWRVSQIWCYLEALVAVASSWRGREQIFTIKLRRIEIFSQFHDGVHRASAATGRRSGLGLHPTKSWNSNLCFLNISDPGRLLAGLPGIHLICLYFLWVMISGGAVMSILYLEGAFSTLNISSNKTFLFSVQNVNICSRFFGIFIGIFHHYIKNKIYFDEIPKYF